MRRLMLNFENRIKTLQDKIQEEELFAALLFYSRDVLYYTGTAQPSYLVVIPKDYFLFVRSGFDFALNDAFIPKGRIGEERKLENIYKEVFLRLPTNKSIGTELEISCQHKNFAGSRRLFPVMNLLMFHLQS